MTTAGGLYLPQVDFTAKPSSDIGTVVPQETLNAVATPPSQQQAQCAAIDTAIPITYGTDRIGARVADLAIHNGQLMMFVVWGWGPYDGLVNFTIDDAAPPAGVTATHYDGTQVAADPTLAAVYGGGYADVLANVVYSVVLIPAGATAGFPQLAATWRGRKLYDHRGGLTVWSDNPSLATADYLASTVYGMGKTMDQASVDAAADANDALVGGVKRRTFGLTLDTRQEASAWRDTLRTYAGCWVLDDGQSVRLIPDRPGTSVAHFDHDAGNLKSLSALKLRGLKDVPTVMEIAWTDTSQTPWREAIATAKASGVDAGTTPIRLSRVALPGIRNAAQANREAIERLNKLNLADLSTEIDVFDEAVVIEPGDVVQLSHPVGLAAKPFRVSSVAGQLGRYRLALDEYDPACWSDSVATDSTYPDTNLPNPASPPSVTGLVIAEENFQLQDGRWSTRLRATWDAPAWAWLRDYRVVLTTAYATVTEARLADPEFVSGEVKEDQQYQLDVFTLSAFAASPAASAIITPLGKALRPTNIETLDVFEVGGEVHVTIGPSIDKDLKGLEARYGATGCAWDDATFIGFAATSSDVGGIVVTKLIPVGTWDILACGRDTNHYSPIPIRAPVTVTLDANAFLINTYEATNPTLTAMAEYRLAPDDAHRYFVTSDGLALGAKMSGALVAYSGPLAALHGALDSVWEGEPEDFGVMLSGSWQGVVNVVDLVGDHVSHIGLSADGLAWSYLQGLSQRANGRFGRLRHSAAGAATLQVIIPAQSLRVDVVPRVEPSFRNVMSLASGGKRLQCQNTYTAFTSVNVEPLGASAISYTLDDLLAAPVMGLQIEAELPTGATGDSFSFWDIADAATYTTQAGDHLEVDVFPVAGDPASQSLLLYHGVWGSGTLLAQAPLPAALGVWSALKVAVIAGLSVTHVAFVHDADSPGLHKTVLKNLRVTDGAGTVRHSLYGAGGEPSLSQSWRNAGYLNRRCGPANSLLVYLWSGTTQVANPFNCTVEAV